MTIRLERIEVAGPTGRLTAYLFPDDGTRELPVVLLHGNTMGRDVMAPRH